MSISAEEVTESGEVALHRPVAGVTKMIIMIYSLPVRVHAITVMMFVSAELNLFEVFVDYCHVSKFHHIYRISSFFHVGFLTNEFHQFAFSKFCLCPSVDLSFTKMLNLNLGSPSPPS